MEETDVASHSFVAECCTCHKTCEWQVGQSLTIMHPSSDRAVLSEVISLLVKYIYMTLPPATHLC